MYILLILLFAANGAAQENYVVDRVCADAMRTYRINGEAESTWSWMLKDADGNQVALTNPAGTDFTDVDNDGKPIRGSEINMNWDVTPGTYNLSVEQTSIHGCKVHELGQIEVYPSVAAYAGEPITSCMNDDPVHLNEATASDGTSVEWTTSGDGSFDDATSLNPLYFAGTNDQQNGTVTLTLTATRQTADETFDPAGSTCTAEATVTIELIDQTMPVFVQPDSICQNSTAPTLPLISENGITGSWNPDVIATDTAGTFTFTFTPDAGQCAVPTTMDLVVIPQNLPPVANNDEANTRENTPITISVLDNDSDDSGIDSYRMEIVDPPQHGSWIIESDYTITYVPEDRYVGTDEFTYRIYDDGIPCGALSDQANVTITIESQNQSPIAVNDEFIGSCQNIFGDLLLNDYDPDDDQLVINTTPITQPMNGTVTIYEDGTFLYEFTRGSAFVDSFSYGVCDDDFYLVACTNATVYITITADSDCDGVPDNIDIDDDNDGIIDTVEGDRNIDTDGDGVPNSLDADSDNDGIVDIIEAQEENGYVAPSGFDKNGNGLDDIYEPGSQVGLNTTDTDEDGIPDYIDLDSDNDGVPDNIEGYDTGAKGIAELIPEFSDTDGDGLDDAYDNFYGGYNPDDLDNPFGTDPQLQDFDNDGTRDWRDTDDDDDLIPTIYEDLNNNDIYYDDDIDGDGHPEYLDMQGDCTMFIPEGFSPNGDGIHDYFQIYCIDQYPNAKLLIFDRWGEKMYEHEHYGNMTFWESFGKAWWDGSHTNDGQASSDRLAPGNYLYILVKGDGNMERGFVMISY